MDTKKVRGRGRPPVDTDRVSVRLARDVLDGIDKFASDQDDKPSRTEAVRRIIREYLEANSYLPLPPEKLD